MSATLKIFALRLHPGNDLKKSIIDFVAAQNIKAGCIITAVGSLTSCCLRYVGQSTGTTIHQKFEILSLSGTLSTQGVHLHIALADSTGKTIGGHLLDGNIIYTTAEIIIGENTEMLFKRVADIETGYTELVIENL